MEKVGIDTNRVDQWLLAVSWTTTISFILVSTALARRWVGCAALNFMLVAWLLAALIAFHLAIASVSLEETFLVLQYRIFDGTLRRFCLLLFWMICVLASALFCVGVNLLCRHSSTVHRKFFHLAGSLVAISGLFYDPALMHLCSHLVLEVFLIIELFRSLRIDPWSPVLNHWLLIFVDEAQESERLLLTPIFLLIGIFFPFLFSTPSLMAAQNTTADSNLTLILSYQWYLSGVQTVGIGDAFAALFGHSFGRMKWKASTNKSMEGSAAMFLGQLVAIPLIVGDVAALNAPLAVSAALTTLVEAHLPLGDNVALPAVCMAVYAIL